MHCGKDVQVASVDGQWNFAIDALPACIPSRLCLPAVHQRIGHQRSQRPRVARPLYPCAQLLGLFPVLSLVGNTGLAFRPCPRCDVQKAPPHLMEVVERRCSRLAGFSESFVCRASDSAVLMGVARAICSESMSGALFFRTGQAAEARPRCRVPGRDLGTRPGPGQSYEWLWVLPPACQRSPHIHPLAIGQSCGSDRCSGWQQRTFP